MERNLACIGGVKYHSHQSYPFRVEHPILEFSVCQSGNLAILSYPDWFYLERDRFGLVLGALESKNLGTQVDASHGAHLRIIFLVGPYILNGPSSRRSDRCHSCTSTS